MSRIDHLGKGMSIDDALIEGAVLDLSPEEISARLGGVLSPARVMVRTRELLRSNDWLTEAEKERALLRTLQERVQELRRANDLDSIKAQFVIVKELLAQIQKRQLATDDQLATYNTNVGRELGRIVDLTLTYMKGALRNEIEPQRWDDLVQEALIMAQNEIAKKQVEAA
jgi:hypothetical protein